jgi:hypothetical protein
MVPAGMRNSHDYANGFGWSREAFSGVLIAAKKCEGCCRSKAHTLAGSRALAWGPTRGRTPYARADRAANRTNRNSVVRAGDDPRRISELRQSPVEPPNVALDCRDDDLAQLCRSVAPAIRFGAQERQARRLKLLHSGNKFSTRQRRLGPQQRLQWTAPRIELPPCRVRRCAPPTDARDPRKTKSPTRVRSYQGDAALTGEARRRRPWRAAGERMAKAAKPKG